MNLVPTVTDKVSLFPDADEREIILMLVDSNVQEADDETKGVISEMFMTLSDSSSSIKFDWLREALRELAYYGSKPAIFRVNKGENFSIDIYLEDGRDFTGYNLTIRKADDNTLLSPNDTQGDSYANNAVQQAYINDLSLQKDDFYKVHVLLEKIDNSNLATGDAVTLLTKAWLLVEEDIDSV